MFKIICVCLLLLALVGCGRPPRYTITASAPAYIEIGGIIVCPETPCTITPPHRVRGYGGCLGNEGVISSMVEAFPIDKTKGYLQRKVINAKCNDNATVYFDMKATTGVKTIQTSE
jgi:hypothetical protein